MPHLLVLSVTLTMPLSADQDQALLKSVERGFESNRTAFAFGTIRFRLSVGTAPSYSEALEGHWTARSETEGICVFDGNRVRYESVFPLEEMVARRKKVADDRWRTPLASWRFVTDGTKTIFELISPNEVGDALIREAQIAAGTKAINSAVILPLGLGRPESIEPLTRDIRALNGESRFEKVSLDSIGTSSDSGSTGMLVIKFRGDPVGTNKQTRDSIYRIDMSRGTIPIEHEERFSGSNGGFKRWTVQDDIRPIGDMGWVPFRYLFYMDREHIVREVRLLEADFTDPPPSSSYRLEFEEPRTVRDQIKMLDYKNVKIIDIANLPSASSATKLTPRRSRAHPPLMPGERAPANPWPFLGLALGFTLLIMAYVAYSRRRSRP